MNDLVLCLMIIVVTLLFLLLAFAPPRREKDPHAHKTETRKEDSKRKRQVRRASPFQVLGDSILALFGSVRDVKTFEGEPAVHWTRRHWVTLLIRGFVPALLALFTGGLAFFRWRGGMFIAPDIREPGQIGPFEIMLILAIFALLFLWQRSAASRAKDKKKPTLGIDFLPDLPYVLGAALLGVMLYFRLQGGELLYTDPLIAGQNDYINQILIGICFISLLTFLYIVVDWANDFLILTPTRIVYEDTQLLVRQVQQEILIDNIQQVNVRADSYFAYLLGYVRFWRDSLRYRLGLRSKPADPVSADYAKIIVGSFSPQTLSFDRAARPYDMQAKIQTEVGKLRKQQDAETLRRLIENQIYEHRPPKSSPPGIEVEMSEHEGLLAWFRHPNPEVRREGDFYALTWRPVKLFLLQALARPYFTFLLPALALWFFARLGLLPPVLALLAGIIIAVPMLGWGLWIREEHENDKFILNIREVVDVDKRPFGPESSRRAPLSAIQNIEFDMSFVESILGYGDVLITTAGAAGKFTFEHVPDPRGVQATINNYLSYFKRRETERNMKSTIDLLEQYHKLQAEYGELSDNAQLEALIDSQVSKLLESELPAQVERQVAVQVPREVNRRVLAPLRRQLWRSGLFRRRRRVR